MKKLRPMPSPRPWPCVILAIDPGETSGWAVFAKGALIGWGEINAIDDSDGRDTVVYRALGTAYRSNLPCALVIEKAFRASIGEGGAARTLWRRSWVAAGGKQQRIVGVYPSVWRSQYFGRGAGSWRQEKARGYERMHALAQIGLLATGVIGNDVAAAICIGAWASRAMVVGAKLPKRCLR